MSEYAHMTRAQLIARLRRLERREQTHQGPVSQPGAETRSNLADTAERLRAILQTAVEAIITVDEHGTVESMNPAAEKRRSGYRVTAVSAKR